MFSDNKMDTENFVAATKFFTATTKKPLLAPLRNEKKTVNACNAKNCKIYKTSAVTNTKSKFNPQNGTYFSIVSVQFRVPKNALLHSATVKKTLVCLVVENTRGGNGVKPQLQTAI